ncbi:hypothetical protein ACIBPB_17855 [Micromonospora sp. NPDC049836]|uniref:hypothetical protein n=1 Tax=Micromonospora sp. NPDC049836 TaxID=3364274 RepID=UPI003796A168
MPAIALTCPVWWVTRWTARMLATLAVVVACALGAATLPVGAAATARAATDTGVVDAPAGPAGPAEDSDRIGSPARLGQLGAGPVLRPAPADLALIRPAAAGGTSAALVPARPAAAGGTSATLALARPGAASGTPADGAAVADLPTGGPAAAPAGRAVPRPAERQLAPAGPAPATVGPRAPPAG